VDATASPVQLSADTARIGTGNKIDTGGLSDVLAAADPFVMQYTDGLRLKDVAWGELSLDALSQQTRIITFNLAIEMRPPYLEQVQS
jgi:hypothetical protein